MTYRAWICEGCGRGQRFRDNVWDCPGCGKEGCDSCFWMYAHCKPCCEGKTDEELRLAANEKGFDFDPPEPELTQPGAAGQESGVSRQPAQSPNEESR